MKNKIEVPTLFEYGGGQQKYELLIREFYDEVAKDELLSPIFLMMDKEHVTNVAYFLIEVFEGPKLYTQKFGEDGIKRMIGKHIAKNLTENQRRRWMDLLLQTAEESACRLTLNLGRHL